MMQRWGLEGMGSFEQVNVAQKERSRLQLDQTGCGCGTKEAGI